MPSVVHGVLVSLSVQKCPPTRKSCDSGEVLAEHAVVLEPIHSMLRKGCSLEGMSSWCKLMLACPAANVWSKLGCMC